MIMIIIKMQNNSSCDVVGWAFWLPLVISTPGIHHSSLQLDSLSLTFFPSSFFSFKAPLYFPSFTAVTFIFQSSPFSSKKNSFYIYFSVKNWIWVAAVFSFFFSEFQVNLESFIFLCIWVIFYFLAFAVVFVSFCWIR